LVFLGHLKEDEDIDVEDPLGDRLVEDLKVIFKNVARIISRDSDGALKVIKQVRITLEDTADCVKALVKKFEENNMKLQVCLECSSADPADPLRLDLAASYANASEHLNRLSDQAEKCKSNYSNLMEYFHHKGMKSSAMILLLDDLFVPRNLMLSKSETVRKKDIQPRFCTVGKEISADDMYLLWGLGERKKRRRQPAQTDAVTITKAGGTVTTAKASELGKAVRATARINKWRNRVTATGM